MARKKKTDETQEIMQDNIQETESKNSLRIIFNKDTELRKFPTLQRAHIVNTGKKGTMYEVIQTVNGLYGSFYKLNNGFYVIKEGDYTLV